MLKKTRISNDAMPSSAEFVVEEKGYPAAEKQSSVKTTPGALDEWQNQYGDNRLVLMIRDPYWCFVYWDFSVEKQAEIVRDIQFEKAKLILRIYDVTGIVFDGSNAYKTMDIEISPKAANWYINVWEADCSYCVDIGLLYPDRRFVTFIRSNIVTTPRDSISNVIDEEWMIADETFAKLYRTAGAGEPGPVSEAINARSIRKQQITPVVEKSIE